MSVYSHRKPTELSQGVFIIIDQWLSLSEHLYSDVLGDFVLELKDASNYQDLAEVVNGGLHILQSVSATFADVTFLRFRQ